MSHQNNCSQQATFDYPLETTARRLPFYLARYLQQQLLLCLWTTTSAPNTLFYQQQYQFLLQTLLEQLQQYSKPPVALQTQPVHARLSLQDPDSFCNNLYSTEPAADPLRVNCSLPSPDPAVVKALDAPKEARDHEGETLKNALLSDPRACSKAVQSSSTDAAPGDVRKDYYLH